MAIQGRSDTYKFLPDLAQYIDAAFNRCGIDPADLNERHVRTACFESNLMLKDWVNTGYREFSLEQYSLPLVKGQAEYDLPNGGYDIFHAVLKRDGYESEMYPISRSDYNALTKKTNEGRPDRYFVDRSNYTTATAGSNFEPFSKVYLWQTPENSTDTIEMWYMRQAADQDEAFRAPDISPMFANAFADGLAFHLSTIYAPDRRDMLGRAYRGQGYDENLAVYQYGGSFGRAVAADRETADTVLRVRMDHYRGRR